MQNNATSPRRRTLGSKFPSFDMALPVSGGNMVECRAERVKPSTDGSGHQFYFRQRFGSFDWRKLAALGLDDIIKGVNLEALQTILDDVTFSKFQESDFCGDPGLTCKLMTVLQLIVEYQLHCQEETEMVMHTLIQRAKEYHKALEQVKSDLANEKRDCRSLKRSNKHAEKVILALKRMLVEHGMITSAKEFDEFTTSPSSIPSLQLRMPERVERNCKQLKVRASANNCKLCGKVFSGEKFLQNHLARRHGAPLDTVGMEEDKGVGSLDVKNDDLVSSEKKKDEEDSEDEKAAAKRLADLLSQGEVKLEQERKKHQVELNQLLAEIEELKKKEKKKHNSEFNQLRDDIEHLKKVVVTSPPTQVVNDQVPIAPPPLPQRNREEAHSRVQRMLSLRKVLRIVRSSWNLNREVSHIQLPSPQHSIDVLEAVAPTTQSRGTDVIHLRTPQEMVNHAKRRSEIVAEVQYGSTELSMLGVGGSGDGTSSSNSVELVSGRVLHSSNIINPAEIEAERKSCLVELNNKAETLGLDETNMKQMSNETFACKLAEVAETRNVTLSEGVRSELSRLEGEITELEKQYRGGVNVPRT